MEQNMSRIICKYCLSLDWYTQTPSICMECFHSCAQHLCKIIGAKASVYTRKVSLIPARLVGTPSWLPFCSFGISIWPLPSHVKTLYTMTTICTLYVYIPLSLFFIAFSFVVYVSVEVRLGPTSFVATSWNSYSVKHSVSIFWLSFFFPVIFNLVHSFSSFRL